MSPELCKEIVRTAKKVRDDTETIDVDIVLSDGAPYFGEKVIAPRHSQNLMKS